MDLGYGGGANTERGRRGSFRERWRVARGDGRFGHIFVESGDGLRRAEDEIDSRSADPADAAA